MDQREPNTGSTFGRRLGTYLAGVAIGLLLLGWFQMQKQRAASQQAPAGEAAPATPDR